MEPADSLNRRLDHTPLEEGAAGGDPDLAPAIDGLEDLDASQNADALKQDPDEVPNRLQEPEPPREEEVGL